MDDAIMVGLLAATVFGLLGAIIGFIYGFKIRGDVYEQIAAMKQKEGGEDCGWHTQETFTFTDVAPPPFQHDLTYQGWKQKELDRLKRDGVEIGKDGRCKCSCGHVCPLGHVGSTLRCTKEELEAAGHKTRKVC